MRGATHLCNKFLEWILFENLTYTMSGSWTESCTRAPIQSRRYYKLRVDNFSKLYFTEVAAICLKYIGLDQIAIRLVDVAPIETSCSVVIHYAVYIH